MLTVQQLSVAFGGDVLFDTISFRIGGGDRIGLIGKNGAGKSTMLRVLAQQQELTSGQLAYEKNTSIGYLPQDVEHNTGKTVLEEAYTAFPRLQTIEQELQHINHNLDTRTDYESAAFQDLLNTQANLNQEYELLGGYTYQAQTARILVGLGFKESDFHQQTITFSGGWRMRIELAKLLLQEHDLLLLDEPTNHLDIEAIIWLEAFLAKYAGAVVLVSHDIRFLDQVTNRTLELVQGKLFDFKKSYTKYLEHRGLLREQQLAAKKNQDKKIAETEKLIEKFRAKASKARMAQSLIKKLDKVERIAIDPEENATMAIHFPVAQQPGKVVLELENIRKTYGEHQVLNGISLLVPRGSKIAFVGQNGQGKTTLAKIIVNEIEAEGSCRLGHNVQLGYFAQNQAQQLDPNKTVLDTALDAATHDKRPVVRDMLGAFLFRDTVVEKKVGVLSGGERNRLALCKLLLQPFNVLVMDEPTNHLDIRAKEVLKNALLNFEGTLLLVSHDRDFLTGLCDRIFEFKNQKIKEYLGGLEAYLQQKALPNLEALNSTAKQTANKPSSSTTTTYADQKALKKIKNQLQKLEGSIEKQEKELKAIDLELEINYGEITAQEGFFDRYQAKKDKLNALFLEWEKLQEQLEAKS
ncbi:MAG: ABC-F family ATP-binding cassette domain-containing protein [Flavobacteriaceae bacterium]